MVRGILRSIMARDSLAILNFGPWPVDPGDGWMNEAEHAVEGLFSNFQRMGQMVGEASQGIVDGNFCAYLRLPATDSLNHAFVSIYGRKDWDECTRLFGREPRVEILDPGDSEVQSGSWVNSPWFVLFGGWPAGTAPLRDHRVDGVPSYLFPIDADLAEKLFFWAKDNERLEGLWFSGGCLEEQALRELADPLSYHMLQAFALARKVEDLVHKPVYINLFRHYRLPESEEGTRPCPLCGESWDVPNEAFDFRCEPCRLVCDSGPAEDENDWSNIGTWQGERRTRPDPET